MNKQDIAATYRIQFHKGFNFSDFEGVLPYLIKLGIKTIYAAPVFKSMPDSVHGYDTVSSHEIDPEIGTLDQLYEISKKLKAASINWIQDIVPNHMAFHPINPWINDVLEKGMGSHYADYFDIDWKHPAFKGKLMLPILPKPLSEVINEAEISIVNDNSRLSLKCAGMLLPLQPESYRGLDLKAQLPQINNDPALLKKIIDRQHYCLCPWQEAEKQINFRRFFTINSLICLNMQYEHVFYDYHSLIAKLCKEDIFQGLRVDHVDGLFDATEYLFRLRETVGKDIYIVVEKILGSQEPLPPYWPIQGTTGYDFLAIANNILTNTEGVTALKKYYNRNITEEASYHDTLIEKKELILNTQMNGELDNLCRLFISSQLADEHEVNEIGADLLKKAVGRFLILCPVYKYYGNLFPLTEEEAKAIKAILEEIKKEKHLKQAGTLLEETLLALPAKREKAFRDSVAIFYQRCMQFTGVLMAKGGEDTAMYTYNRLLAHNDVGDTPKAEGYTAGTFHSFMEDRQQNWPHTLNATATHDTKRGEDARARLNILSDIPDEWLQMVKQWQAINARWKKGNAPDENDEYLIYQALVGAYPMPGQPDESFNERIKAYIEKALREAKTHTNWASPDEVYERNTQAFLDNILTPGSDFIDTFSGFLENIVDAGIINSLVQLTLKFTSPGIPDTYQGCELWDLSMVDPDNRRPVDYELRTSWLNEIEKEIDIEELWRQRYNGKIKLWLTRALLCERNNNKILKEGRYIPLQVTGKYKTNILAFARETVHVWYVVVVPVNVLPIAAKQKKNLIDIDWEDTAIVLPNEIAAEWRDIISGRQGQKDAALKANDILHHFPVAILKYGEAVAKRSAGILLPLFSVPSSFGIGDFGTATHRFIDFLVNSGQRYWQLLPINPVVSENMYSPYSSTSSMGVNTLFISPEKLAAQGLLSEDEIRQYHLPSEEIIAYDKVADCKQALCNKAYTNFCQGHFVAIEYNFRSYCFAEAHWLDDYALYAVLKENFKNKPWYQWELPYKKRDKEALEIFARQNEAQIKKVKWLQFIATSQWKAIRKYANNKGIRLFGDIPFYMGRDSADVWANPEIFCIDADGNIEGVAGVPPDYFSKTGQLWGMPTYNWNKLKYFDYEWWLHRLRKNADLFDIVRLDHFRAFEAYWEVPADSTTAEHGRWIKGPGIDFFNAVKKELGTLPFIAEDLGDYMADVYRLRDKAKLPGMKVIQFAWGDNMPVAVDAPHNFPLNCVVYTGTHDNNTTKSWFEAETKKADRERLNTYTNTEVNKDNAADILSRMAYASVAALAILPIQDILNLDADSRINTPGTMKGNWAWRLQEKQLSRHVMEKLLDRAKFYNRL